MKARAGQVAVYLVLVLVAITVLVLMNVGTFLAVSARNTTMNGGDAAALAVARYQGELLNRIGRWNIEHLQAALAGNTNACAQITTNQLKCCFLDPLEGIAIGNQAAKNNGCDRNDGMLAILRQHAFDIRQHYVGNPELYPEPWEGAWEEYARRLEIAIAPGIYAGPDNIDFMDPVTGHMLLNQQFYQAIAGMNWCWFKFNAPDLLERYTSFGSWGGRAAVFPEGDGEMRRRKSVNSEVYSLNLDVRVGSAIDLLGKALIMKLTGASEEEIDQAPLLTDPSQAWFFYGRDVWRIWWELETDGEWGFPAMGRVRPEYNVRGCAAICRVTLGYANVLSDVSAEGEENTAPTDREAVWSAAAKPFGTVETWEGSRDAVTALNGFVTDAFTEVRLVPLDGVGGRDLSTANPEWMNHVHNHLVDYLERGPRLEHGMVKGSTCWYCQQLKAWESSVFRSKGRNWLRYHSSDCVRPTGGGGGHGGSAHGH